MACYRPLFILLSLSILFLAGCTTISGRTLPIVTEPTSTSGRVPVLLEFEKDVDITDQDELIEAFKASSLLEVQAPFSIPRKYKSADEVKTLGDLAPLPDKAVDWKFKFHVRFESKGFFEPYCIFTLMLLPCAPPIDWTISIGVYDRDGKRLHDYSNEEKATEVTWLFGFLLPSAKSAGVKRQEVLRNQLNNIYQQMIKDRML